MYVIEYDVNDMLDLPPRGLKLAGGIREFRSADKERKSKRQRNAGATSQTVHCFLLKSAEVDYRVK
jgi:hypothetical protein